MQLFFFAHLCRVVHGRERLQQSQVWMCNRQNETSSHPNPSATVTSPYHQDSVTLACI